MMHAGLSHHFVSPLAIGVAEEMIADAVTKVGVMPPYVSA
jgi:hypothetical protein